MVSCATGTSYGKQNVISFKHKWLAVRLAMPSVPGASRGARFFRIGKRRICAPHLAMRSLRLAVRELASIYSFRSWGKGFKMTRQDRELLDKQLWGVSTPPPTRTGIIGLMTIVVFIVGIATGGMLFGQDSEHAHFTSAHVTVTNFAFNRTTPLDRLQSNNHLRDAANNQLGKSSPSRRQQY